MFRRFGFSFARVQVRYTHRRARETLSKGSNAARRSENYLEQLKRIADSIKVEPANTTSKPSNIEAERPVHGRNNDEFVSGERVEKNTLEQRSSMYSSLFSRSEEPPDEQLLSERERQIRKLRIELNKKQMRPETESLRVQHHDSFRLLVNKMMDMLDEGKYEEVSRIIQTTDQTESFKTFLKSIGIPLITPEMNINSNFLFQEIISASARRNDFKSVQFFLEEFKAWSKSHFSMISADTYNLAMKPFILHDLSKVKVLLQDMEKNQILPNQATYNIRIALACAEIQQQQQQQPHAHSNSNATAIDEQLPWKILNEMKSKCINVTSMSVSPILELVKNNPSRVHQLMQRFREEFNHEPGKYEYIILAKQCADLEFDEILRLFPFSSLPSTAVADIGGTLASNFVHYRRLKDAERLVDIISIRCNVRLFKVILPVLISAYCDQNNLEKALNLLSKLKSREQLTSAIAYEPILSLLIKGERPAIAAQLLSEAELQGLSANRMIYLSLAREFAKTGELNEMINLLKRFVGLVKSIREDEYLSLVKEICRCKRFPQVKADAISCLVSNSVSIGLRVTGVFVPDMLKTYAASSKYDKMADLLQQQKYWEASKRWFVSEKRGFVDFLKLHDVLLARDLTQQSLELFFLSLTDPTQPWPYLSYLKICEKFGKQEAAQIVQKKLQENTNTAKTK